MSRLPLGDLLREHWGYVGRFTGAGSRAVALANTAAYVLPALLNGGRHPMGHLLRSPLRFLVRFEGVDLTVRVPSYDLLALKEVWHRQVYEALGRTSGLVCDVGAQIGCFTLKCAASDPATQVLSFEPAPDNLSILRENVERNRLGNVTVHGCALGDSVGTATLYLSAGGTGHHSLAGPRDGARVEVEVRTLDSVVERSSLGPVRFLKVDVEGFEMSVLRGARRTLERDRPQVAVEVDSDWDALVDFLRGLGYERFRRVAISPLTPGSAVLNAS